MDVDIPSMGQFFYCIQNKLDYYHADLFSYFKSNKIK